MKRARVSKLSGTGECSITVGRSEGIYLFRSGGVWTALFVHRSIFGGSRVICQGAQEGRDEVDFI